jgi:geranylgeranyl diphosphate synthase type II
MDIRKYIILKKRIIDKALDRYLPLATEKPQVIHRAMRYAVFPGGKRIRPIFTIAGFEVCGGKGNSVMPVACAIELIHSYTLVHDDLPCMDDDDFRRGKKTCHKKFGEDIALLAGDSLLTLAFNVLSAAGSIQAMQEISRAIGSCGVIAGQVADIINQKSKIKNQRLDIDFINYRKTALLFEVAVKIGGIIKGAGERQIKALGDFGRDIGLSFQLMDDLKDRDGHVKIYGVDCTQKKADFLKKRAKSHLKIFGKKAGVLLALVDLIC